MLSTSLKPSTCWKSRSKPLSLMVRPATFSSAAPSPPSPPSLLSQLFGALHALVLKEADSTESDSARVALHRHDGMDRARPAAKRCAHAASEPSRVSQRRSYRTGVTPDRERQSSQLICRKGGAIGAPINPP